jgi:hypothetical protein
MVSLSLSFSVVKGIVVVPRGTDIAFVQQIASWDKWGKNFQRPATMMATRVGGRTIIHKLGTGLTKSLGPLPMYYYSASNRRATEI